MSVACCDNAINFVPSVLEASLYLNRSFQALVRSTLAALWCAGMPELQV